SPLIATSPPRTMRIEMTMATIGRLMKKVAMIDFLLRNDLHSAFYAGEAFGHHALAGLQPFIDDPVAADALSGFHGADRDGVIGTDDGDLLQSLKLVDRALRNEERRAAERGHGADFRELSRAKYVARIRKEFDGRDRARFHIDFTSGKR